MDFGHPRHSRPPRTVCGAAEALHLLHRIHHTRHHRGCCRQSWGSWNQWRQMAPGPGSRELLSHTPLDLEALRVATQSAARRRAPVSSSRKHTCATLHPSAADVLQPKLTEPKPRRTPFTRPNPFAQTRRGGQGPLGARAHGRARKRANTRAMLPPRTEQGSGGAGNHRVNPVGCRSPAAPTPKHTQIPAHLGSCVQGDP